MIFYTLYSNTHSNWGKDTIMMYSNLIVSCVLTRVLSNFATPLPLEQLTAAGIQSYSPQVQIYIELATQMQLLSS